jgi:hypothetical protein
MQNLNSRFRKSGFRIQRPTAVAAVLSIRNGGRVFLPANRRNRGLENPRSVKDHKIEFQERMKFQEIILYLKLKT